MHKTSGRCENVILFSQAARSALPMLLPPLVSIVLSYGGPDRWEVQESLSTYKELADVLAFPAHSILTWQVRTSHDHVLRARTIGDVTLLLAEASDSEMLLNQVRDATNPHGNRFRVQGWIRERGSALFRSPNLNATPFPDGIVVSLLTSLGLKSETDGYSVELLDDSMCNCLFLPEVDTSHRYAASKFLLPKTFCRWKDLLVVISGGKVVCLRLLSSELCRVAPNLCAPDGELFRCLSPCGTRLFAATAHHVYELRLS